MKKNWNFQSKGTQDQSEQIEKLWSLAGKKICAKDRIEFIEFKDRMKLQRMNIDYIFALDESGSMQGEKWKKLI